MDREYDLVVVGSGVTSAVASRCREAGWTVAVVDRQPFGGTCALRGCVPKKILVGAAEAVNGARDLSEHGVPARDLAIDWPQLVAFKRALIGKTTEHTEHAWTKIGIDLFHGVARFVGPTTVAIGDDRLTGRKVLIAAGSMPAPLTFPGAERVSISDEFLDLPRMPSRVLFIGGGYISFEFAHVAARAGAEVTIVHRGARPLEPFDPDLVNLLLRRTRELGIRMALGASQGDVLKMVVRQGLALALMGIAVGLVLAFAASRLISNMLFDVSATDIVTFVAVPSVLAMAALVASYVPALRATRIDPMIALRYE